MQILNPQLTNWRRFQNTVVLVGLLVILIVIFLISLSTGSIVVTLQQSMAVLLDRIGFDSPWQYTSIQQTVIEQIRLPRIILAVVIGIGLAACGATMQALFRNPLADPGLLGISSCSAFVAVLSIVIGLPTMIPIQYTLLPFSIVSLASFSGGLIATWLIYRIGKVNGRSDVATMLLTGIAINSIAGAAIGFLTYVADDQQLRGLIFWSLGSLGNSNWQQLAFAIPIILLSSIFILCYSKTLNAILLGEAEAEHLGFNLERSKRRLIMLVALVVGVAVSLTGVIGFIGLVVPHLIRLTIGPDHRMLLPASAILGAILLLSADLGARLVIAPSELPIGIVTALLGGTFFLALLLHWRHQYER